MPLLSYSMSWAYRMSRQEFPNRLVTTAYSPHNSLCKLLIKITKTNTVASKECCPVPGIRSWSGVIPEELLWIKPPWILMIDIFEVLVSGLYKGSVRPEASILVIPSNITVRLAGLVIQLTQENKSKHKGDGWKLESRTWRKKINVRQPNISNFHGTPSLFSVTNF